MINKERVKHLRLELQGLLDSQYGLDFLGDLKAHVGNASFTDNNVTFKIELSTIAENGDVLNKASEDFKLFAGVYGMKPEDFGKSFKANGHTYTICGLKPRSDKYPIIAQREDGKKFKFGDDYTKIMIKGV